MTRLQSPSNIRRPQPPLNRGTTTRTIATNRRSNDDDDGVGSFIAGAVTEAVVGSIFGDDD